jgi:hypothetical protein
MSDRPRKTTRLTVSLEEQDYEALSRIALSRDVSLSWVVRQAIRQLVGSPPNTDGNDAMNFAKQKKK